MLKLRSREEQKLERLNLVPVMDAVFIFIFFLLFSAQFIKIFQIETHAPVVSNVPTDKKMDDEPLNLTLKLTEEKVEVFTGIDPALQFRIYLSDRDALGALKAKITLLRQKFAKDDDAIVSPAANVSYSTIVKVIEAIQFIPEGEKIEINYKKKKKVLEKIYSQVVLEPLSK